MKKIIIISCCVAQKRVLKTYSGEFHFKGFYLGEKLNKLKVDSSIPFTLGEEYMLYVEVKNIYAQTLTANLIHSKLISKMTCEL